jgi:hypothetical protein
MKSYIDKHKGCGEYPNYPNKRGIWYYFLGSLYILNHKKHNIQIAFFWYKMKKNKLDFKLLDYDKFQLTSGGI